MHHITKTYHFSAAHIIPHHPKCQRLHGHNYRVDVTIASESLDEYGMVFDFGNLKRAMDIVIGPMDHKFLMPQYFGIPLPEWVMALPEDILCRIDILTSTAEDLAYYIWGQMQTTLGPKYTVKMVRVWETEDSYATFIAE